MMKKSKITRVKLESEEGFDYALLGLVSAEPDYKLSLAINKKLGVLLKNIPPVKPEQGELTYSRFSNSTTSEENFFTLTSNRSGKSHLIEKLKNIDFLLQLYDLQTESEIEKVAIQLRNIDGVTAVFIINTASLKDKNIGYLSH